MQQYIITVPENPDAKNLLNYIIKTGYFKEVKPVISEEEIQQQILKEDLTEALEEVELMKKGKKQLQTLNEFIDKS
jgi:hypothetical protein